MSNGNKDKPKISEPKGINFICGWEGFKSCPYLDEIPDPPVWTIGYGQTQGVNKNTPCQSKAEAKDDLRHCMNQDYIPSIPKKNKMKQREIDGLGSFAWNCGVGAVSDPDTSTLARRLKSKEGDTYDGRKEIYRDELKRWNKAGGKVMEGLTKRREAEKDLCCKGDYSGRP